MRFRKDWLAERLPHRPKDACLQRNELPMLVVQPAIDKFLNNTNNTAQVYRVFGTAQEKCYVLGKFFSSGRSGHIRTAIERTGLAKRKEIVRIRIMPSKQKTTVVLTEKARKLRFADPLFAFENKELLSAGIELFAQLSEAEQAKLVARVKREEDALHAQRAVNDAEAHAKGRRGNRSQTIPKS